MPKKELKYKIEHFVLQLPRQITIGHLLKKLNEVGISNDSFYRDKKIEKKSSTSIPEDRLFKYAKVFGCSTDDLLNYNIQQIKSIQEDLLADQQPQKVRRIRTKLS
jgi:hypothetical protein